MSVIHQMLRDLEAGRENGSAPGAPTGPAASGAARSGLSRRLPRLAIATSLLVLVAAGLLKGPVPGAANVAPAATVPVVAHPPPSVPAAAPAAAPAAVAAASASRRGHEVTVASLSTTPPSVRPRESARTIPDPVAPAAPSSVPNATSAAQPAPVAGPAQSMPVAPAPLPAQGQVRPPAAADKAETATDAAAAPPRIERRAGAAPAVDGADAHYRKGVAAYNAGRLEEALRSLRAALAEQPAHVPARQALVAILVDRAEWASAQAALAEALAADPRQAQFALLSSQIQVRMGDPAAAIRTLAAAVDDKAPADLHATLAGLLSQARRDREALAHWIAALGRAPDRGGWWLGFGVSLEADGRTGDAAQAYQRALAAGGLNAEVADFARGRVASLR
jgi:MSHA biogenesis protein MshN